MTILAFLKKNKGNFKCAKIVMLHMKSFVCINLYSFLESMKIYFYMFYAIFLTLHLLK